MTPTRSQLLFIDDDANVIASTRRALRGSASQWQLHCANGGQEALDIARNTALDVVITDMRMPGMDGASLLARIHETHPTTVRMVLSGQSERDYSVAAAKYAHRFLSKPCLAEDLSEHIRSTLESRARLNAHDAGDLLTVAEVPVESEAILSGLNLSLAASPYNSDAVCGRIREHSAIVLKFLQLVSSSFFARTRPSVLLREAVTTLGPDVLRSLLKSDLFKPVPGVRQRTLVECHRAAWRAARFAKRITHECSLPLKDRDVLVTAAQLVTVNESLRMEPRVNPSQPNDVWQSAAKNAAESAALLQLWGVPEPITRAMAEFAAAATGVKTTLQGSILALAIVLSNGSPAADVATSEFPGGALESILRIKSIEGWTRSASDWLSEEACG